MQVEGKEDSFIGFIVTSGRKGGQGATESIGYTQKNPRFTNGPRL